MIDQLHKIELEYSEKLADLATKEPEMYELTNSTGNDIQVAVKDNPKLYATLTKFKNSIEQLGIRTNLMRFKAICNTRQLTSEQKSLFNQDVAKPFWMEQDLQLIYEAVSNFMMKYSPTTI